MWLINVHTYKLQYWQDNADPIDLLHTMPVRRYEKPAPYAILSHTWGAEEVSFQDMQDLKNARTKAGFWKIARTCEQAKVDNVKFAWVDTCCIDKTSSAELQEAINSMFRWYQEAKHCYAYLADVPDDESKDAIHSRFKSGRWLTRGWCLQELIAPRDIAFYGKDWQFCGMRSSLRSLISSITRVDPALLIEGEIEAEWWFGDSEDSGRPPLATFSVAKRMSWASTRQTTRIEDVAYSLFGLFEVNLPLMYGEGSRAFLRLQEEILRVSGDTSILLWDHSGDGYAFEPMLLAPSPAAFVHAGRIDYSPATGPQESASLLGLSSAGLRARLPVILDVKSQRQPFVLLDCFDQDDPTLTVVLKVKRRSELYETYDLEDVTNRPLYLVCGPLCEVDERFKQPLELIKPQSRVMKIDATTQDANVPFRDVILLKAETRGRMQSWTFRELESISSNPDWSHFPLAELITLRLDINEEEMAKWRIEQVHPEDAWTSSKQTFLSLEQLTTFDARLISANTSIQVLST